MQRAIGNKNPCPRRPEGILAFAAARAVILEHDGVIGEDRYDELFQLAEGLFLTHKPRYFELSHDMLRPVTCILPTHANPPVLTLHSGYSS